MNCYYTPMHKMSLRHPYAFLLYPFSCICALQLELYCSSCAKAQCFIGFDDKETREIQLTSDKFARKRYIWKLFSNSVVEMLWNRKVTINEQQLAFSSRCRFIQYLFFLNTTYTFWVCESGSSQANRFSEIRDRETSLCLVSTKMEPPSVTLPRRRNQLH